MKKLYWLAIYIAFPILSMAQLSISHPISRAVYQRNGTGKGSASITIAGQFLGSAPANYRIEYRLEKLLVTDGSYVSTVVNWTTIVSNPSFGLYSTSTAIATGWYQLSVRAYNINTSSTITSNDTKFGVGDVYLIAGQSNAQGESGSWSLPSDTPNDGVVSINLDDNCNTNLPAYPVLSTLSTNNRIAPSGNNSWNWLHLGKELSTPDTIPQAFFNSAYGGTSVQNWAKSAVGDPTDHVYIGGQYCGATGMPYKSFKNTSQFYVPLFGAKAGLWHQGETDNEKRPYKLKQTTRTHYKDSLEIVLAQARTDLVASNFSWLISRASYNGANDSGFETRADVIDAQNDVIAGNGNNYNGPETDALDLTYRDAGDKVHFREDRSGGLTALSNLWEAEILAASYNRILSTAPPVISVSKIGSTFYLSAPNGQSEYRWVSSSSLNINSPVSTSQTYTTTGGSYACYVRNSNNQWTLTSTVSTSCGSCREAAKEWDESEVGIETSLYPNPASNQLTVSYSIPNDSQVKLDLLNAEGRIIKSIFEGFQSKGKHAYPIQISHLPEAQYLYRITINGLAITKKIVKIN